MTRKICVITGSRAEYGLLTWLIKGIADAPDLELQIIATGAHLSPEFGLTYREIEADGHRIDRKVEMLLSSDTPNGVTKSTGLGMIGCADALTELKPDIVVVLGDRFEILAAASATLFHSIPLAHIHGGETSEGAFDESVRHAITKMAHLHFVAAEPYRHRVIQLGEDPQNVFLVGGLGIDAISRERLLSREALEMELGIKFGEKNLLVTYHPATLEAGKAAEQMQELLASLDSLEGVNVIFTMPNADTEGRALFTMIQKYVAGRPGAHAFTSLGHRRYLSCLQFVDGVVGNSSSGLAEAPTFHIGTINIGARQRGRLRADSVIDAEPTRASITAALGKLFSKKFRESLKGVENPYGSGGASEKIVRVLREHPLENILQKRFFDIQF